MKKLVKSNSLDLWICEHFKVLPTERRFLDLQEDQKMLLLYGFLEQPTDADMYVSYNTKVETVISESDAENLVKVCGYTPEQVKRIQANLDIVNRTAT